MLTGEVYSCNAVTRVTTHPCSEHEEIIPNVLADGKCGIGRVIFCAVASKIELSCVPEVSELLLRLSAAEAVEFHVHVLCFAWNCALVGYPYCC